jgi:hypothetical protein
MDGPVIEKPNRLGNTPLAENAPLNRMSLTSRPAQLSQASWPNSISQRNPYSQKVPPGLRLKIGRLPYASLTFAGFGLQWRDFLANPANQYLAKAFKGRR